MVVSEPSRLSTARVATFEFVHDDPAARLRCRVDRGRRRRCSSPYRADPLTDGRHRFEVDARGRAAEFVWLVDATPPPAPAITWTDPARFSFTGRRTSCSLDGAPAEPCTSPVEYAGLEPGEHRFSVTARDRAGNASSPLHEWTMSVAPEVETGAAGTLRPTSAEVTGTAPHAAHHFEYGTTTDLRLAHPRPRGTRRRRRDGHPDRPAARDDLPLPARRQHGCATGRPAARTPR